MAAKKLETGRVDRRVLRAVHDESVAEAAALAGVRRAGWQDRLRRGRVNRRQLQRILRAGAKQLGLPPDALDRLHEQDHESCRRQAAATLRSSRALLRRKIDRQKELLRHVLARRERYEYDGGNPVSVHCLWRAVDIVESAAVEGGIDSSSFDPSPSSSNTSGRNGVRFGLSTSTTPGVNAARLDVLSTHSFQVTSAVTGVFRPTGFFSPNGSYALTAAGACFGGEGSVVLVISARLRTSVRAPAGDIIRRNRPPFQPLFSDYALADCDAASASGVFAFESDAEELGSSADVLVSAGDLVILQAQYRFEIFFFGGATAEVDCASPAGAGLNVPLVSVRFES